MSINILGGIAKGLSLFVPKDNSIRPTTVMLKRKIFDRHQNLEDYYFIDLCTGTGSIGLEAWSRGANFIYLVEENPKIFKILEKNVELLKGKFKSEFEERSIKTSRGDAFKWIQSFRATYEKFDQEKQEQFIIYIDPPYEKVELYGSLLSFLNQSWFKGVIWLEGDNKKGKEAAFWSSEYKFEEEKAFFYGDSFLLILKNQ